MNSTSRSVGNRRIDFADTLVEPARSPRAVVEREDFRVSQLLDEPHIDFYAGQPKWIALGRRVLTNVGLFTPTPAEIVERPWLESAQASRTKQIELQLNRSKEAIREGLVVGVDDIVVDSYIGLRDEESILPPLFRRLHQIAEEQEGRKLSFLGWMADHATNEQLLNVWQWHDHYLKELDDNPEFKERVAGVKKAYLRGCEAAIEAGDLDPAMRISQEDLDAMSIVHASPLSPYTATTLARADQELNQVSIRPNVSDQNLFHEITHLAKAGFIPEFNEGPTDIITATVYNHAHAGDDHYDLHYEDHLALIASLEHLTEGRLNLRELSRMYAGATGRAQNTAELIKSVDDELGVPLIRYALKNVWEIMEASVSRMTAADLVVGSHYIIRDWVSIMEGAYFDEQGKRIHHTAQSLFTRLISADMIQKYDPEDIRNVLYTVLEATQDQHTTPNRNQSSAGET